MIKSHGQHAQFNAGSQEESPPISSIRGKAILILSTAFRKVDENNPQSNAWSRKLVLCVDGKKRVTDRQSVRGREGEPPTTVGKTFLFPVLHEEDERPRSEGVGKMVPTSWRGEKAWHGNGLLASQSLPQPTKAKITKGGGDTQFSLVTPCSTFTSPPRFLILWNHVPSQFSCCEHNWLSCFN